MRVVLAVFVVSAALAGCIDSGSSPSPDETVDGPRVLAYDGYGVRLTTDEAAHRVFETVPVAAGAEPNIGVARSGSVFVTGFEQTYRSTDSGATWELVFDQLAQDDMLPANPATPELVGTSDPMLWADPFTDRVYTDHMVDLACSNLSWSDDDGETWLFRPLNCGIPVNDHMKIATAPWHGPAPQPTSLVHASVLYYCYNKLVSTNCAVSLDGGVSYAYDRPVTILPTPQTGDGQTPTARAPCGGINGHPAPAPDGTMYVPFNLGCAGPVVARSMDNGLTWTIHEGPRDFGAEEIDPDMTVTPDGTAYISWRGSDHLQYLARSSDQFVTWDGPWRVSPPHITSTAFTGITSQKDGSVAIAFLGTDDTENHPQDAENETRWHLWQVHSTDAAADDPTFTAFQVTQEPDPVQIGCIWLSGGGNPCRNMLDYIDMASDANGRTYVAITDGCATGHEEGDCAGNATATHEQSRSRLVTVAILKEGEGVVPGTRLDAA